MHSRTKTLFRQYSSLFISLITPVKNIYASLFFHIILKTTLISMQIIIESVKNA